MDHARCADEDDGDDVMQTPLSFATLLDIESNDTVGLYGSGVALSSSLRDVREGRPVEVAENGLVGRKHSDVDYNGVQSPQWAREIDWDNLSDYEVSHTTSV